MINPSLRHDTLRQWPVERLPSFEDDEDDAAETVRMPERPWHVPAPSSRQPTNPMPSEASANLDAPTFDSSARFRDFLENTERWLARLSVPFDRPETRRARWVTAALATALFAALEILDAHSSSQSVAAHVAPRAAPVPSVIDADAIADTNAATKNSVLPNAQPVESLPLEKTQPSEAHPKARHLRGNIGHSRASAAPITGASTYASRPFDTEAARNALDAAASSTRRCTRNQMAGTVIVSFSPSGEVTDVTLGTLAGDIIQTHCVVQAFRNVRIAPFAGHAIRIRKTFAVSR